MTTKPPSSGLATGTGSSSDEETIDDSLDEILLEAHEKPLENPILPPQGVPKLQLPQGGSATLLGAGIAPVPLPGVAPPPPDEVTPPPAAVNPDQVTQIARPSLLDEATDDEETKVGPAESARRAAANREDDHELELALTE